MLKKLLALVLALFTALAMAAVDVNKATDAQLDSVKGIGPVTSKLITSERKKGEFKDWQDFIDRIKGIGDKRAANLSAEGLTVNGKPYKNTAAVAKDEKPAAKDTKAAATEDKKEAKASAKEEKKDAKATAKEEKKEAKAEKKEAKATAKEEKKEAKAAAKEEKAAAKEDKKSAKVAAAKPAASAAKAASAKK